MLSFSAAVITVEYVEVMSTSEFFRFATGEFDTVSDSTIADDYGGVNPLDTECGGVRCIGMLTTVSEKFMAWPVCCCIGIVLAL